MNSQVLTALLIALIQAFFAKNPTAQEIEVVLPQLVTAFSNAKAGQAWEVTLALTLDNVPGTFSAAFTPNAAPAAAAAAPTAQRAVEPAPGA